MNSNITTYDFYARPLPKHIAIIMDGNGRWATYRGLARLAGHRAGIDVLDDVLETLKELGVKHLTVYAFSTENWKRPSEEVDGLMKLLVDYLQHKVDKLMDADIKLKGIGNIEGLPTKVREQLKNTESITENNKSLYFNIALNYGGRQEILNATKMIVKDVCAGDMTINEIDEQHFSDRLYTNGQPDPDLLIRSSGEFRLSNFMLWQIAYAEIWLTKVLWPDFTKSDLLEAIVSFQQRDRRYGGLGKQGVQDEN